MPIPALALALAPTILGALGLGTSVGFGVSAAKKQEEYQKQQEEYQKKLEEEQKKQIKKQALSKALGLPSFATMPKYYGAPTSPSLVSEQIGKGIGDIIGQYGPQVLERALQKYNTQNILPTQPYQSTDYDYLS